MYKVVVVVAYFVDARDEDEARDSVRPAVDAILSADADGVMVEKVDARLAKEERGKHGGEHVFSEGAFRKHLKVENMLGGGDDDMQ